MQCFLSSLSLFDTMSEMKGPDLQLQFAVYLLSLQPPASTEVHVEHPG